MYTRLLLTLACTALGNAAHAWEPTGSLADLADRTSIARLRPSVQAYGFSSYDRTGGNNDGFSGTYSRLREEVGNSVLAEMDGPGCIQRIWFTHSVGEQPGLLERKGEHIRVYLDGNTAPAIDLPIEQLFDGTHPRFPNPLAGEGVGGFYCYVPIPYEKSCKVVVDGLGVRFYQINYVTFPAGTPVKPFTMKLPKKDQAALDEARARWNDPAAFLRDSAAVDRHDVAIIAPGRFDLSLGAIERNRDKRPTRQRPTVLHGFALEDFTDEEILNTRIEIRFDGATEPAIDLPLTMLFGEIHAPKPFESLYMGQRNGQRYFVLPMPFLDTCDIRLKSVKDVLGRIITRRDEIREDAEGFGYLHSQYHENLPTNQPGVLHPFLKVQGKGHYVGTYLATDGQYKLPYWMEGDDQWRINGELRIHGTGSEDYFNCGWYALPGRLDGPGGFASHGFPVYRMSGETNYVTCYRWHAADPVPFYGTIDVGIEHGEANQHVANYRSVAYYYLDKP